MIERGAFMYQQKRHRLRYDMSSHELISTISDGKPITLAFLIKEFQQMALFDFVCQCCILDSIGIYGSNIIRLYYEYCHGNSIDFHNLILKIASDTTLLIQIRSYLNI